MQGSVVPAQSQEYKVKEALISAGVSHNSEVVANFANVRVDTNGLIFFCTSRLTYASQVKVGDGGVLPDRVRLEGDWDFPTPGYYDLRNARIVVNGAISLIKEPNSEIVCNRQYESEWAAAARR